MDSMAWWTLLRFQKCVGAIDGPTDLCQDETRTFLTNLCKGGWNQSSGIRRENTLHDFTNFSIKVQSFLDLLNSLNKKILTVRAKFFEILAKGSVNFWSLHLAYRSCSSHFNIHIFQWNMKILTTTCWINQTGRCFLNIINNHEITRNRSIDLMRFSILQAVEMGSLALKQHVEWVEVLKLITLT